MPMLRYIKTAYVKLTCSARINTNYEQLPNTNFKRLLISTLLSTLLLMRMFQDQFQRTHFYSMSCLVEARKKTVTIYL